MIKSLLPVFGKDYCTVIDDGTGKLAAKNSN